MSVLLTHFRPSALYALMIGLQRLAYYGIRSVILFYMMSSIIGLDQSDAYIYYSVVTMAIYVFRFLGGLVGDTLFGSRNAIAIGGVLMSLGAFGLCVPSKLGLVFGAGLIVLGDALFSCNVIANFGRNYQNRANYADAGFLLLVLAVLIGGFLAPQLKFLFNENTFIPVFAVCGVLSLLSILPLLIMKAESFSLRPQMNTATTHVLPVLGALATGVLFWLVYSFACYDENDAIRSFFSYGNSENSISFLCVQIGVYALIAFTFLYLFSRWQSSQLFKLMLAFVALTCASLLMYFINHGTINFLLALLQLIFAASAELLAVSVCYAILARYVQPRFLATLLGVYGLTTLLVNLLTNLIFRILHQLSFINFPFFVLIFCFLITVAIIVFWSLRKNARPSLGYQTNQDSVSHDSHEHTDGILKS
ncbi:MAG: hypothetical protein ACRCYO_05950 [Bacteroidia bacterium]